MKIFNETNFPEALQSRNLVVACFYSENDKFCKDFLPVFEKQAGMTGIEFIKVNITDEANPLRKEYEVKVLPAIRIFRNQKAIFYMDGRPGAGLEEKHINGALARVIGRII